MAHGDSVKLRLFARIRMVHQAAEQQQRDHMVRILIDTIGLVVNGASVRSLCQKIVIRWWRD